ncbi:MAG TPA: hypothetical protein VN620_00920 [Candidatus Methylomirabilis sp.]|nr:hypothetical protein [Candidatus Methylomirabilis sp.]
MTEIFSARVNVVSGALYPALKGEVYGATDKKSQSHGEVVYLRAARSSRVLSRMRMFFRSIAMMPALRISPAPTAIGRMVGLSDPEMEAARGAASSSPKNAAALEFARQLVAKRGLATEADIEAVRRAGFTDAEIAEIIAHVALNIFTNYFNNTAGVEVDFPKIALRQSV